MTKRVQDESQWVTLVRERYEPDPHIEMSYEDENYLLWLLNAPEQYEVEDQMLTYAKAHEKADMKELMDYFDSIAPQGLPPCASEWDDDEE